MASIIKKTKKGRPYYYAVQSKRVGGKPRIVWQKYLGTIDAIIERTEEAHPQPPKETVIFEAGGVAALLRIAQLLGLEELIDQAVPKREQGPTVAHYILLAAINRALAPCSKQAIGQWYEATVLKRLWHFPSSVFSSQRFWDHMDMISQQAIESLQDQLVARIHSVFGIDPRILLYDTTNFFTFLATSNGRAVLAQRGHSKAKRHDLRQVGLALLVSKDFQIPLLHRVYPGNTADVTLFPQLSEDLIARYNELTKICEEATLVFDKGNLSDEIMEKLEFSNVGFVAALSANRLKDTLGTPLDRFKEIPELPGTLAFSTSELVWAKQCQVVVAYTESFFTQQLAGVTTNLVKCQKKLMDIEHDLSKWRQGKARGKKPDIASVRKAVRQILAPQFMKDLIQTEINDENGLPRLIYSVNHSALHNLTQHRLGRTMLVSNRLDWTAKNLIETYRSLTAVEETFKNMKNVDFLRWQPAHHWTDQKLKVHAFYCVLALLLSSLARKRAHKEGIELSLPALLKELSEIREVAIIYPQATLAHRKDHMTLSRMSPRQLKLANCLQIQEVLGR